jgi:hypothetical protein
MRFWTVFAVATSAAVTIAACGGDDASVGGTFPTMDASVGIPDSGPTLGDGSLGNNDGSGQNHCTPKTCADQHITCGPAGDGCGNVLACGTCTAPETCGGGGTPSQCGGDNGCVPRTCATANAGCGPAADGCGNLLQCGDCTAPATCGGAGTASQCGTPTTMCTPLTCAQQNVGCGPAGDGCGGTLQCGTCTLPMECGGAGTPAQCGVPTTDAGADAASSCTPRTCAQQGITCGPAGDGCGNTLQCGTCVAPQSCGGGGTPSQCGGTAACVPKTCQQLHDNCGPAGDGCGGTLQCGTCTAPQSCGGGGTASQCGGNNSCTPQTCASLGLNCGVGADGCGNTTANCGGCVPPDICGGGGIPGQCGDSNITGDAASCTGLCLQIPACDDAAGTTISGRVYAGTDPTLGYGAPDPIQHAHVFIPNDPSTLVAFGTQVACACDTASGPAIATTYSAIDGSFTLTNVPAGNNIPIVIQLGRWRRVYYANVAQCQNTSITDDTMCRAGGTCNTRMPRHEHEFNNFDNIPLIAEVTGSADPIECVLPKIGIDTTSYSDPSGTGRVRFFKANGAKYSATTPADSTLWASAATLEAYDMVIFDCEGGENDKTAAAQAAVMAYANAGGRVFASHYSYVWTFKNDPWGCGGSNDTGTPTCTTAGHTVADWYVDQGTPPDPITALIDNATMSSWLSQPLINILPAGQISVSAPRHDLNGVIAPNGMGVPATQLYMHANPTQSASTPLEFTFNTNPFGTAAQQCGRVLFSDFHVNTGGTGTGTFPGECPAPTPLTPQEKVLEFMLFDLGDCVTSITPPPPPTCTARTCAEQGISCGPAGDGCGGALNCGTCTSPATCGGGGTPNQCGGGCTPETCASQNISCGPAGNGCGGTLACGTCVSPQTCGGGGVPGQCGMPTCTPITCASQNIMCGPAGNGCGGSLNCGSCTTPETCGGGGVPGQCGQPDGGYSCTPITCASQGITCGPAGDGCGNLVQCGTCVAPQTCGGGGVPGQCGNQSCVPTTCAAQNLMCGPAGNGCGGTLDCGTCTPPQTCGGGGTPGVCGMPNCTPETCASQGLNCGPAGDGCGGSLSCGTCVAPLTCGGGGTSGVCGQTSQPH